MALKQIAPDDRFKHTRNAHQNEVAEDYVETILDLIEEDGDARLLEIARRFGVSHPTASKILMRLEREELLVRLPYKSFVLTPKGKRMALASRERHKTVVLFLCSIGVDRGTAERDAEGIEHHCSRATLKAMEAHIAQTASK